MFSVGSYSYSELLNEVVDSARRANITNVITARNPINRGVRRVVREVDLRSLKRKSVLGTNLFDDIYIYPSPSDLKGNAIIDIIPQINRGTNFKVRLVTQHDFDIEKTTRNNIIAVATDELVKTVLYSGDVDDTKLVVSTLDATDAGGGTWSAYNDAANLAADVDNKVKGAGSLKFDLTGEATTAGIVNTTLTQIDISDFTNNGVAYVWVYINSTTNLTNFILEIGNDLTTNYYQMTETDRFDGTAFVNGWNLLKFNFSGATENGTVTDTEIDAVRLYMTKTSGKSDDGYRFDHLELHKGEIHDILYYSRYGWQNSSGTFLEDSTADTDLVNAETDEFDGFVFAAKMELFRELRRFDLVNDAKLEYLEWKRDYVFRNPSERLEIARSYYRI